VHRAAVVREGSEALSRGHALALALAMSLAPCACRRPEPPPRAEIAGAWLREPERTSGFDLRPDGGLGLLNMASESGLRWSLARGALVLSVNDAAHLEWHAVDLELKRLEGDSLELAGDDARFAGWYRRATAAHVRGVVTYRERMALPPDAHVEVELSRDGAGPVALAAFAPGGEVPIAFELSLLAPVANDRATYSLVARIADRERTLFATPEPVPAPLDADIEVLLRSAR
jgi:type III secretion system (T3SS) chaperone YscW